MTAAVETREPRTCDRCGAAEQRDRSQGRIVVLRPFWRQPGPRTLECGPCTDRVGTPDNPFPVPPDPPARLPDTSLRVEGACVFCGVAGPLSEDGRMVEYASLGGIVGAPCVRCRGRIEGRHDFAYAEFVAERRGKPVEALEADDLWAGVVLWHRRNDLPDPPLPEAPWAF
jgi:hypothetical protein